MNGLDTVSHCRSRVRATWGVPISAKETGFGSFEGALQEPRSIPAKTATIIFVVIRMVIPTILYTTLPCSPSQLIEILDSLVRPLEGPVHSSHRDFLCRTVTWFFGLSRHLCRQVCADHTEHGDSLKPVLGRTVGIGHAGFIHRIQGVWSLNPAVRPAPPAELRPASPAEQGVHPNLLKVSFWVL